LVASARRFPPAEKLFSCIVIQLNPPTHYKEQGLCAAMVNLKRNHYRKPKPGAADC
jgi:hypothetical protein